MPLRNAVTNGGAAMPTRNVVLTERQEGLIEALVQSGRYQNASEVMREGLRLVENREVEEATKLEALRAAAQIGVSALDRGEFKEFADRSALVAHLNKVADEALSGAHGN
jgi:antitoxin ParD1/3/4